MIQSFDEAVCRADFVELFVSGMLYNNVCEVLTYVPLKPICSCIAYCHSKTICRLVHALQKRKTVMDVAHIVVLTAFASMN